MGRALASASCSINASATFAQSVREPPLTLEVGIARELVGAAGALFSQSIIHHPPSPSSTSNTGIHGF